MFFLAASGELSDNSHRNVIMWGCIKNVVICMSFFNLILVSSHKLAVYFIYIDIDIDIYIYIIYLFIALLVLVIHG